MEDNINATEDLDSLVSHNFESPGGSKYWKPSCSDELKPRTGLLFDSIEAAFNFYVKYAGACGFDVRRSAEKKYKDGSITSKYFVCNRNGEYKSDDYHEGKRKCMISRCGCNAKIIVRACLGYKYEIKRFIEDHNHELANDDGKHFMKTNRHMDISQMLFCYVASKLNMGAVRAHSLMKELYGGFKNIGSTAIDFKNMNRDVRQHVGDNDGEMIVRKLMNTKDECSGFFFDYRLDNGGALCCLFWADPISIRNFELFGDAMSVDATFRSNRYHLKFVTFTGLDNHRKLVTFGGALIAREDIDSYTWVFDAFLRAMGREPKYIVTDQCPAMKQAVPSVFVSAKHRLCAWHIMKKFPMKINANAEYYGVVLNTVSRLVYSTDLCPQEFENGWKELFSKYELTHIGWLNEIYENRKQWVTAFHGDVEMGGLLRTTSISESVNSFFQNFFQQGDTIIELHARFESAIDRQRNEQAKLNHHDRISRPALATPKKIEVHVSEVYTRSVFYEVQLEIKGSTYDVVAHSIFVSDDDDVKVYTLSDIDNDKKKFEVKHFRHNNVFACNCRMFLLRGIPCRHLFYALAQAKCDRIPDYFLVKRWMKNCEIFASSEITKHVEVYRTMTERSAIDASSIWLKFQSCLNLASCNQQKIAYMKNSLENLENTLSVDAEISMKKRKNAVIESIVGPSIENEIGIKKPEVQSYKGCRTRIRSSVENSQNLKANVAPKKRTCSTCGMVEGHNSRTCPSKGKND